MEMYKEAVKSDKGSTNLIDGETPLQCKFFLKKKSRFCRFRPKVGQQYCPEHACIMGIHTERKRIPCPLNPKHNCYEDEVDKHVKKCNVTKIQQKVEKEVYYMKGVNRGTDSCSGVSALKSQQQISVKDLNSNSLGKMIETVKSIYKVHVEPIQSTYFQHPCVQDEICSSHEEDINNALKNQAALRKELVQQAGLIGQMEREKFLDLEENYIVELGAGKGKLSHWIRKACRMKSKNKYLLVERGSVRYKVDGHQEQNGVGDSFKRIKMDIEDLFLGYVPGLEKSGAITVVGKHLCGGATDMGLRCAVNTLQFKQLNQSESAKVFAEKLTKTTEGLRPFTQNEDSQNLITTKQHETSHSYVQDKMNINVKEVNSERTADIEENISKNAIDSSGCANYLSVISTHPDSKPSFETLATKIKLTQEAGVQQKNKPIEKINDLSQNFDVEPPNKIMKTEGNQEGSSRLPDGIMIALCCHHQCTWDTYVGKSFIESCGLGPQEFDVLTRLSSWATCARVRVRSNVNSTPHAEVERNSSMNRSQADTPEESTLNFQKDIKDDHLSDDLLILDKNSNLSLREQLSVSEREIIGRQCKRIIDTGRLHYLRSKGMTASLREYIDADTTPENVVLVAYP